MKNRDFKSKAKSKSKTLENTLEEEPDSDDGLQIRDDNFKLLFDKDNFMLGKFKPYKKVKRTKGMPAKPKNVADSKEVVREKANEWIQVQRKKPYMCISFKGRSFLFSFESLIIVSRYDSEFWKFKTKT